MYINIVRFWYQQQKFGSVTDKIEIFNNKWDGTLIEDEP